MMHFVQVNNAAAATAAIAIDLHMNLRQTHAAVLTGCVITAEFTACALLPLTAAKGHWQAAADSHDKAPGSMEAFACIVTNLAQGRGKHLSGTVGRLCRSGVNGDLVSWFAASETTSACQEKIAELLQVTGAYSISGTCLTGTPLISAVSRTGKTAYQALTCSMQRWRIPFSSRGPSSLD